MGGGGAGRRAMVPYAGGVPGAVVGGTTRGVTGLSYLGEKKGRGETVRSSIVRVR